MVDSIAMETAQSLRDKLGLEFSDAEILLAKNMVLGFDDEDTAEQLGVTKAEVEEFTKTERFQQLLGFFRARHVESNANVDFNIDSIEETAWMAIAQRLKHDTSLDTNLRVAALANKADRRTRDNGRTLRPGSQSSVSIRLTSNIIQQMSGTLAAPTRTKSLLIEGEMSQPTKETISGLLDGVDGLAGVLSGAPEKAASNGIPGKTSDPAVEALRKLMSSGDE